MEAPITSRQSWRRRYHQRIVMSLMLLGCFFLHSPSIAPNSDPFLLLTLPSPQYLPSTFITNASSSTRCPICNFTPANANANSSPEDLVLSYAGGNSKDSTTGFFVFLRSFRTTLSKASLVIFVQEIFLTFYNEFASECGVNLVPIYNPPLRGETTAYHAKIRFLYAQEFLAFQGKQFKRILWTDLGDVVFQGDPFTTEIDENKMYVLDQDIPIKKSLDQTWIKNSLLPSDKIILSKVRMNSVNCGSIIGGIRPFSIFVDELLRRMKMPGNWIKSNDQGILEILILNGFLQDKANLSIHKILRFPYGWIPHQCKQLGSDFGSIAVPHTTTLYKYFHGYWNCKGIQESLRNKCPPINDDDTMRPYSQPAKKKKKFPFSRVST